MKKVFDFVVEKVNRYFGPLERFLVSRYDAPKNPFVFILGQPRSGSTLFQQLLAQRTNIAYVSNLQAKFWITPFIGAFLIHKFKPKNHSTDYSSNFGNTKGYWEPHEWGWYWQRTLDIDVTTGLSHSWNRMRPKLEFMGKQLAGLESIYRAPLIFDNVYVFPYVSEIAKTYRKCVFLYIRRDNLFVANSIINAKLKRFGHLYDWYGPKPKKFHEILTLPSVKQCVAQVHGIEEDLKEQLLQIEKRRIHIVDYDDICDDPEKVLEDFSRFISVHGFDLNKTSSSIPSKFINRNDPKLIRPELKKELEICYAEYFGKGKNERSQL